MALGDRSPSQQKVVGSRLGGALVVHWEFPQCDEGNTRPDLSKVGNRVSAI